MVDIQLAQDTRFLKVKTPLGPDTLILQAFNGSDELSRPFSYNLDMLSERHDIVASEIVGQIVSFSMKLQDGSERYFNGIVNRFTGAEIQARHLRRYQASVVPWFWFLTRSSDCRIFQEKSIPDIIEEVFGDLGFSHYQLELRNNHEPRTYCVQYRETAFSFVSRLMEEEGIFYWFNHEDGKHTMVLADDKASFTDCPESELDCYPGSNSDDQVQSWNHGYEYRSGRYAQTDYDFTKPSTDLLTSTDTLVDLPNISNYELFDYPGEYFNKSLGESLTQYRMESDEMNHDVVQATSGCRTLHSSGKFKIASHESESEENKKYAITGIHHHASDHTHLSGDGQVSYGNTFTCIPADVIYRPARVTPKPMVGGPQTAVIVGPPGEEIFPDEYGRVKIQFHWDRYGTNDENSSCWIRVSQPTAGSGWGSVQIPRIGQEVIVSCLEGDPDQPIITGRVYNAEQMPPFPLPDSGMVSGMKSNSTPGGGGYNEISMDDTKGKEGMNVHAQYDRTTTIQHDDTLTVNNNRTETIKKDITTKITEGKLDHDVVAGTATFHVKGAVKQTYDDTQTTKVMKKIKIDSTTGPIEIDSNAAHILLQAAQKITLKTGASTIEMDAAGNIEISGVNVAINGSLSVAIKGTMINSEATAQHEIKGTLVKSEGTATNTVKGGMVMLNP